MRIGVDGTALCYPLTGIGHYTYSLLDAIAAERPNWEFVVFAPYVAATRPERANISYRFARSSYVPGWRAWWFDAVLPTAVKGAQVAVFWAAQGIAPFALSGTPVALTVHDLVVERLPPVVPWTSRYYRRLNFRYWLTRASCVLANSEFTASECQSLFGVEVDAVVYPGVDEIFYQYAATAELSEGECGNYFVAVGTIEPRKNLATLLRCVEVLISEGSWPPGLRIYLVGGQGWKDVAVRHSIERLRRVGVVSALGYVERCRLVRLMAGARAFLMPSLYEGFGLPLAEAMVLGCQIICSDLAVFREVLGDYPAWIHGVDLDSMAAVYRRAIKEVCGRSGSRPRPEVLERRFTWTKSAAVLASTLEQVFAAQA